MLNTLIKPMLVTNKPEKSNATTLELKNTKRRIMQAIRRHVDETLNMNKSSSIISKTWYEKLNVYCNMKQCETLKNSLENNIRYIIMDEYQNVGDEAKAILMQWHSLVHLMYISKKDNIPFYIKIKEWLNMHFHTNDLKIHAMRGNFEVLEEIYPELKTQFKEFIINLETAALSNDSLTMNNVEVTNENSESMIMQKLKKAISLIMTSENQHESWKKKYHKDFPESIKQILMGEFDAAEYKWGDRLLYKLLYQHREQSYIIEDITEIQRILPEKNIYMEILGNDINNLFEHLDDFLKIPFFFILHNQNTEYDCLKLECINTIFDTSFKKYMNIDLEYSLICLIFSPHFDIYFGHLTQNVTLHINALTSILSVINECNVQVKDFYTNCCRELYDDKKYNELFTILKKFGTSNIDLGFYDPEFVNFCIKNYENVREVLDQISINDDLRIIIEFLNGEGDIEQKLLQILNSEYFKMYHLPILDMVLDQNMSYFVCMNVLKSIFELECAGNTSLTYYKNTLLLKMMDHVKT